MAPAGVYHFNFSVLAGMHQHFSEKEGGGAFHMIWLYGSFWVVLHNLYWCKVEAGGHFGSCWIIKTTSRYSYYLIFCDFSQIVDLETQILILKEDMIQERADARQEKKRLKQAVVSYEFEKNKQKTKTKDKMIWLEYFN